MTSARHSAWSLALIAAGLLAFGTSSSSAGAPGTTTTARASKVPCGPSTAPTVVEDRQARVFSRPGTSPPGTERLEACLSTPRRSWGLPSPVFGRSRAVLDEGSLTLTGAWLAFVENTTGIDGGTMRVAGKDLRDGATRTCEIGSFIAPGRGPRVVELALRSDGVVAWSAWSRGPSEPGQAPLEKIVGACDAEGLHILDQGPGIELRSVVWKGSVLVWSDGGEPRSATFSGP